MQATSVSLLQEDEAEEGSHEAAEEQTVEIGVEEAITTMAVVITQTNSKLHPPSVKDNMVRTCSEHSHFRCLPLVHKWLLLLDHSILKVKSANVATFTILEVEAVIAIP